MTFERTVVRLRCRPPFALLAVALCAAAGAAGAAFAPLRAGPGVRVPDRLALAAEQDALATAAFELANDGTPGSRLAFEITPSSTTCDAPSPAPWLVVEPTAGAIEAGAVATCSVYASAFGAAAPQRNGFLCIATNDPAQPLSALQVVLAIGTEPAIRHPGEGN
jgi:hypothetical protein